MFLTTLILTMFSLFPVIPYPLVGGVVGAAFGGLIGALMIWMGSTAASIIMFLFIRYGYKDLADRILNRYKVLEKVTILFEKNAFFVIFLTRIIPFIPSIVINVYSGISRVPFWMYTIASALGKIPSMLMFAFVGNSIFYNPSQVIWILLFYTCFILIVAYVYRLWQKKVIPEKI